MNRPGEELLKTLSRWVLIVLVVLGIAAFAVGLARAPERAWHNLLLHNFYFLSLSLMGAFFVAVHYLAKAGWPTVLRRIPEAMLGYLPTGAVLMLPLFFGMHSIYHWTHHDTVQADPILQEKHAFLNVPGFFIRMVVYLGLWFFLARLLVRRSRQQDSAGGPAETQADGNATESVARTDNAGSAAALLTARNVRTSAVALIVIAFTFSLASIEWVMSLEPHWFSTLFPWYVLSSVFASGVALITILVLALRWRGFLQEVNRHHLHDLGKYVFASSCFWGYLWFSQYMLIWYTNIPEETSYYLLRGGKWSGLFLTNPLINLGVPLLLLLPASWKQNPRLLFVVCLIVFVGHWLDFYLMVMPSLMTSGPVFGLYELGIGLGICALFLLCFNAALRRYPLLPRNDPFFEESLHHHG